MPWPSCCSLRTILEVQALFPSLSREPHHTLRPQDRPMGLPAAQSSANRGSGSVTKYLISSPLETPQELPGEIEMFLDPEKSSLTQCHCPGDRLSRCREPVREESSQASTQKAKSSTHATQTQPPHQPPPYACVSPKRSLREQTKGSVYHPGWGKSVVFSQQPTVSISCPMGCPEARELPRALHFRSLSMLPTHCWENVAVHSPPPFLSAQA